MPAPFSTSAFLSLLLRSLDFFISCVVFSAYSHVNLQDDNFQVSPARHRGADPPHNLGLALRFALLSALPRGPQPARRLHRRHDRRDARLGRRQDADDAPVDRARPQARPAPRRDRFALQPELRLVPRCHARRAALRRARLGRQPGLWRRRDGLRPAHGEGEVAGHRQGELGCCAEGGGEGWTGEGESGFVGGGGRRVRDGERVDRVGKEARREKSGAGLQDSRGQEERGHLRIPELQFGDDRIAQGCKWSASRRELYLLAQVMISHQNVIAQCLQVQQITPADHDKVLAVLPSFHITGLVHVLHLPVLINAAVIMLPSFTIRSMLAAVEKHRIGELLLVPPILIRLVRDPVVAEYDLSCVRRFSSGAAPLSPEILQLLRDRFPGTGFKQGYGMTESCSCITAHPPDKYDFRHAHAVGTIVASTEVKIVRPDGSAAGVGEPGEILARGPQVVMGYLENEAATRETFDADGWLHTGDQGAVDADGLVTITDRIKEMIKVKGVGVAPAELEDLLLGHPKVEDVAVLGVPDDYAGEVPKAYVVLKSGVAVDDGKGGDEAAATVARELLAYVRENKVRYKRVREIELVDEIPKSASGKILRRVLRDRAKKAARGVVVRDEAVERAML